jgi:hypothetical protein
MRNLNLEFLTDAQIRRTLIECYSAQHTELQGRELAESIRQFTRQQYRLLGFAPDLRKDGMTQAQRQQLRQHEIATIRLLLSMQQQQG